MPFALVLIGLVMIVSAAKDTHRAFGAQLLKDFTGPGNFLYWIAAIGAVGALGYIEQLRVFSRYFMALILVAMLLANKGFFGQLQEALAKGPVAPERGPGIVLPDKSAPSKDQPKTSTPLTGNPYLDAGAKAGSEARENFGTFIDGLKTLIGLGL
jgi:hypothetical protein